MEISGKELLFFIKSRTMSAFVLWSILKLPDICAISIFAKIYTETLNAFPQMLIWRKKVPVVLISEWLNFKNNSQSLSPCSSADALVTLIFLNRWACKVSLSFFLFLYLHLQTVWVQIGPEYNSGKIVSSVEKFGHAIESLQRDNTVKCPTPMRTIIHIMGPRRKQL